MHGGLESGHGASRFLPGIRVAALARQQFNPCDADTIRHLRSIFAGATEERLHAIFLDQGRRYLHEHTYATGRADMVVMRTRLLLHEALRVGAHGLLLAHNHLSGICRPSRADIASTRRLAQICREVDITLIDHLILTDSRGFSMRAGGYL